MSSRLAYCGGGLIAAGLLCGLVRFGISLVSGVSALPQPDYRDIPAQWLTYRQTSATACPAASPVCFAVQHDKNGDRFVIGSADPPSLQVIDQAGHLQQQFELPDEPLAAACGTAESSAVLPFRYFAAAHKTYIGIYSASGERTKVLKLPEKADVRSIVCTPDYLFAADTGNRRIYRFNAEGILDKTLGSSGEDGFDGFVVYASPMTLAFSYKNGLLYAANPGRHRIDVFTTEGIYERALSWGEPGGTLAGFAGCCNPTGLAILADGRILTVEKGLPRIKIFTAARRLDCFVAGPGLLKQEHYAAAVLSDDRIAVFDFDNRTIRMFERL